MSLQHGRGEGATGVIDMIVDGITHSNYTFGCRVYGWDWKAALTPIDRTGRSGRPKYRLGDPKGNLSLEGQVQTAQYPFPANAKYATGTLTLTQDLGTNSTPNFLCGVSLPVKIAGWDLGTHDKRREGSSDLWDYTLSAIVNGPLTSVNWNGTQVTFTAATLNYCETDVGLSKVIDPNGLTTRATRRIDAEGVPDNDTGEVATLLAYISNAIPPVADLQLNTVSWVRSDSAGGQFVEDWRLRDTTQDVTFPRTRSTRSSQRPFTDSDAYVIAASGNIPTQANSLWSAFQGVQYASSLDLTGLNDQWRVVVYHYMNPGFTYKVSATGVPKTITAQIIGGAPYINIAQNFAAGTGRRRVVVSPINYAAQGREIFDFSLIRNIVGTTLPRQNPQTIPESGGTTLPYFNQVNNATFLGLPATCVIYTGTSTIARFTNSDSSSWMQAFHFHADSFGIITGEPVISRRRPITVNSTVSSTGLVLASSLGAPFDGMAVPTAASFAGFTA